PFVGPAGRPPPRGPGGAGPDRGGVSVAKVVKHFNWEPRGKWGNPKKTPATHNPACPPRAPFRLGPAHAPVPLCRGATAAQALLGRNVRIIDSAGKPIPSTLAPHVLATLHPSAVLRASDEEAREAGMRRLVQDLATVARLIDSSAGREK